MTSIQKVHLKYFLWLRAVRQQRQARVEGNVEVVVKFCYLGKDGSIQDGSSCRLWDFGLLAIEFYKVNLN